MLILNRERINLVHLIRVEVHGARAHQMPAEEVTFKSLITAQNICAIFGISTPVMDALCLQET